MTQDPTKLYPGPPFEVQHQGFPGKTTKMVPEPDHGETSYKGSGRLHGKAALVTGGDSGIGRAVVIAFAREGVDVAISYLPDEESDAKATAAWVEQAGRKVLLLPGDVTDAAHCRDIVARTVGAFGKIDVLVNNAAYETTHKTLDDCSDEDWDRHFKTNVYSNFYLTKAASTHMKPGGCIVNTASVNSKNPTPSLFAYSATKGAIGNLTVSLAQLLAAKGIRVNGVMPGPIWTPFIPAGMTDEDVKTFGAKTPFGRPGQPAELAPAYVMLASDEASYMSGALITVAGGLPIY